MSGVGELALDALYYGSIGQGLTIPFARGPSDRPKLAPNDKGLIYDVLTKQLLEWGGTRWQVPYTGTPVETLAFPQVYPSLSDVPRVGAPVTCLPGTWAGYPAPTFSYLWTIDGGPIVGGGDQFGRNAEELALLQQGKKIRCVVTARQHFTSLPPAYVPDSFVKEDTQASGYIRPAL
jgi:hypothetical protein